MKCTEPQGRAVSIWRILSLTEPAQRQHYAYCLPRNTSDICLNKHRKTEAGILVIAHLQSRTKAAWPLAMVHIRA